MPVRRATHAGSWYSEDKQRLTQELDGWLAMVPDSLEDASSPVPVPNTRAIIVPHAGYSYSGRAAAWAYKCLDLSKAKKIFLLGPSHHVYLKGCVVSTCTALDTPLGSLTVDTAVCQEIASLHGFSTFSVQQEEEEHSLEMHMPYIRHLLNRAKKDCSVIPIIVGSISHDQETEFGALFAPYLADPANVFIISSDFCHWGSRFQYTAYSETTPPSKGIRSISQGISKALPIYQSITAIDREGMDMIESQDHAAFSAYLERTKNTICGRHPIGVLMAALARLPTGEKVHISFVRYEQSNSVRQAHDSSVSYASAYVTIS